MTKKMLIDAAHPEEVRVALLDQGKVEDFDFESAARKPLRGNIFLARVTRVEPSLQAAFVEYGGNRHGFLAFSEIHPDYYQIPVSDRELIQQAEAEVADLAAQLELTQRGDEDEDGEIFTGDDGQDPSAPDDEDDEPRKKHASSDDQADVDASLEDAPTSDEKNEDDIEEEEEEEEENEEGEKAASNSDDEAAAPAKKSKDSDPDGDEYDASAIAEGDQPIIDLDDGDAASDASLTAEGDADPTEASDTDDAQSDDAVAEKAEASDADETESDEADAEPAPKKRGRKAKADPRAELFERYKEAKRKRSRLLRNYKIQEVIKRRQILLVQVVKEERGGKGAALTTYMSLAGRYCVLMPNTARGGGISRKIATASDRKRLRRVVDSLEVPQGMGLIIRTAGAKRTKTEIKRDYDYLLRLWENIRTLTLKSIAPCLIYEEASLIKRAIRDLYDKDISKVLVEGEAGYREAKDFIKMLMPSHAKNVQPYKERAPIFLKHNVESQLDGMYQPTVRLKSGGYIVIHQTEALVAIDVNSGRATRERNIELTALKTNIEAAQEAARQFRLRDLAGLIVLDFIDMEEPKNNRKVEKALKDALKSDRARIQVGRISNFGLLEMSRQRRRSGIVDGTTHTCPTCSGAGAVRSHEIASLRILRAIEGDAISGKVGRIQARTSLDVSLYILNHNREWLERIEKANGVKVEILADPDKAGDAFELEKSGTPVERVSDATFVRPDQTEPVEVEVSDSDDGTSSSEAETSDEASEGGRKRRRRRKRRKDASDPEQRSSAKDDDAASKDADENNEARANSEGQDEDAPKKKRRRGRRGGRRNRRGNSDSDAQTAKDDNAAGANTDSVTAGSADTDRSSSQVASTENSNSSSDEKASAGDDASNEAVTAAENNDASEPARNGADRASAKSESEEAVSQVETESAEKTSDLDAASATAGKSKKSAKKGWWQRAIG
ncbi:MAG: Rne/Rng family ribonuclease [Pseudomonadota bacterium]